MALFNIMRKNKATGKSDFWSHNRNGWIGHDSDICKLVLTENDAEFETRQLTDRYGKEYYFLRALNSVRQRTFKICHIGDNTGTNADLNTDIHKGFTIGNGKKLYWEMIWHGSGHVTVFCNDSKRWISGDTLITVHFK